jgi:putative redox protein
MIDRNPTEERPAPKPIVVTHQSGVRFAAQIGAHELILDQPLRGGGHDAGPSPIDLVGAALGSCIGLYVHKFLVARNVAVEGLRVEVTQHAVHHPHRIARFDVHVILPGEIPMLYKPMIEAVARVCPVYNTLAAAAEIVISIDAVTDDEAVSGRAFAGTR